MFLFLKYAQKNNHDIKKVKNTKLHIVESFIIKFYLGYRQQKIKSVMLIKEIYKKLSIELD